MFEKKVVVRMGKEFLQPNPSSLKMGQNEDRSFTGKCCECKRAQEKMPGEATESHVCTLTGATLVLSNVPRSH